ncbi:MAG: hypothetical protein AAB907_02155, partial [Patescibacteria group bacterium]
MLNRQPEVFFSPHDARGGARQERGLVPGSFGEVVTRFIADLPFLISKDGRPMSPNTVGAYEGDMRQLQGFIGRDTKSKPFVDVLPQLPTALLTLPSKIQGLGKKALGRKRASWGRFIKWAQNESYAPDGSTDTFKRKTKEYKGGTGVEKKQKSKGRILSSEEISSIEARTMVDNDKRMSALIRVMLATGRACHEVLALHSGDIFFTEDTEVLMKFKNKDRKMQFVHVDLDTELLLLKLKKGKDDSSALFTRQVRKGVNPEKSLTRQGGWIIFKK